MLVNLVDCGMFAVPVPVPVMIIASVNWTCAENMIELSTP